MPNEENTSYNFTRAPCAQQPHQYPSYPLYPPTNNGYNNPPQNMYELMYPPQNRTQIPYAQTTPNINEPIDPYWLPDGRLNEIEKGLKFTDKIETIEISSKDLSPASCYSNIDLSVPDLYRNTYYNNKNYVEYPSCSQINCEENNATVKYCSIQKTSNFEFNKNFNYDCAQFDLFNQYEGKIQDNTLCFPATQEILPFGDSLDQRIEDEGTESDIVVEDSDEEDLSEDVCRNDYALMNCMICNSNYSPVGNQFYILTQASPLTMSSQKPVYTKLSDLVGVINNIKRNYLCSQCLGLINTIDHLQLKLDNCKNELGGKYEKTNHVTINLNKSPKLNKCKHKFNCRLCKKVFSMSNIYKNHLALHKSSFLCEICGQRFIKLRNFKAHLNKKHCKKLKKIKIEAFICKICQKPFRTRSNLKEHEIYCSGNLPFHCKVCEKKFATTTKLKNHIKLKHDKKFTSICSICNIGFVQLSNFKAHMLTHSTDKKFNCAKCEKSYKTLTNLKFHMKFHSAKLPFVCTICAKGFMRKEYLDAHLNMHKGLKNFACTLCDKRFIAQKNLDAHFKHHDGNIKKKSCNICGKLISTGLEDHLRTHTNLKEFECEKCDMRFNTKGAFFKHKKRKHDLEHEK